MCQETGRGGGGQKVPQSVTQKVQGSISLPVSVSVSVSVSLPLPFSLSLSGWIRRPSQGQRQVRFERGVRRGWHQKYRGDRVNRWARCAEGHGGDVLCDAVSRHFSTGLVTDTDVCIDSLSPLPPACLFVCLLHCGRICRSRSRSRGRRSRSRSRR